VYFLGGLLSAPLQGIQTVTVAAGGAVVVEFKVDVPGYYTLVDHALARSERGLLYPSRALPIPKSLMARSCQGWATSPNARCRRAVKCPLLAQSGHLTPLSQHWLDSVRWLVAHTKAQEGADNEQR
jgi:hypothetical protein